MYISNYVLLYLNNNISATQTKFKTSYAGMRWFYD